MNKAEEVMCSVCDCMDEEGYCWRYQDKDLCEYLKGFNKGYETAVKENDMFTTTIAKLEPVQKENEALKAKVKILRENIANLADYAELDVDEDGVPVC